MIFPTRLVNDTGHVVARTFPVVLDVFPIPRPIGLEERMHSSDRPICRIDRSRLRSLESNIYRHIDDVAGLAELVEVPTRYPEGRCGLSEQVGVAIEFDIRFLSLSVDVRNAEVHVTVHVFYRTSPFTIAVTVGFLSALHVRPARAERDCPALHSLTPIGPFAVVRFVFADEVESVQIRRLELVERIIPRENQLVIIVETDPPGFSAGLESAGRLAFVGPVVVLPDARECIVRL
ncbi:hypothetical protein [Natrinema sp. 1APR25-10V2]|uniref:hypothetical protein n=1 Tax=Natrinema sp. 1APR25-10V2 TaxID=2951081 RepID=UPI002875E32A|nr:hypothetical protein [Natrinema sp. 1APR25-10V2]MDS0475517.1 hypothetical protein [Natrinema sp. 1APR25-10V2]